jgi:transcriptional regulator with XRE-family HTH domain
MNGTELKIEMTRNHDTQEKLAEALGLGAPSAISTRINGNVQFRQKEIEIIAERYNLTAKRVCEIFFPNVVSVGETAKGAQA